MFNESELNAKLVAELREIAKNLNIPDYDELRKQQLIRSIVEQQKSNIESSEKQEQAVESAPRTNGSAAGANGNGDKPKRARRTRIKKSEEKERRVGKEWRTWGAHEEEIKDARPKDSQQIGRRE